MEQIITAHLKNLGIHHNLETHPPVFTVEESMRHMGDKTPVKNLLLKEEKGERLIFVIMHGQQRLDTKRLSAELSAKKLQFAKADLLKKLLGVEPGSASIFSLLYDGENQQIEVVIDAELLHTQKLGFHPNDNTKTYVISGDDLRQFIGSLPHKTGVMKLY